MRILVCGSRDWADKNAIWIVLDGYFHLYHSSMTIIEGGAKGADTIAKDWAKDRGTSFENFPADWSTYGKAAGPIRNKQMLDEGQPDVVWAFTNKPLHESKGTRNMVEQARKAGIPVYVVEHW